VHTVTVRYIGGQIRGKPAQEEFTLPMGATVQDLVDRIRFGDGGESAGQEGALTDGLLESAVFLIDGEACYDRQARLPPRARVTVLVLTHMIGG